MSGGLLSSIVDPKHTWLAIHCVWSVLTCKVATWSLLFGGEDALETGCDIRPAPWLGCNHLGSNDHDL